jgi:hypothetical protein
MNKLRSVSVLCFALLAGSVLALPALAAQKDKEKSAPSSAGENFFIISSVDLTKQQIVLKQPTEVTLLVQVNDKTSYLNEQGKPLKLSDLRAGDTVWAILLPSGEAPPLARRIRKGPMTPAELHRRYLKFQ